MGKVNLVEALWIDNTCLLRLDLLTNTADDTYINDATVVATLYDSDGVEVSGQSWPLTLSYVALSDGRYQGNLSAALVLTENERYDAKITVTSASLQGVIHYRLTAKVRTE